MTVHTVSGVRADGVAAALPPASEDALAALTALLGDAAKAAAIVQASGIRRRRVAAPGTTSLDLGVAAAETLFARTGVARSEIGAVVFVTFTPARAMPCNACAAQARLGLSADVLAFDLGQACAGYADGLFVAATLAKTTGRRVLLLDADVQTPLLAPGDASTAAVLADAGTATLVSPDPSPDARPWRFAFLCRGDCGEALTLARTEPLKMDGFSVFKFVATDVRDFLSAFLAETGTEPSTLAAFAPHQANVYMIRQLARSLAIGEEKLLVSGDEFGNSASASVPVTLALRGDRLPPGGTLLLSGFGGGLSASAALLPVTGNCSFALQ